MTGKLIKIAIFCALMTGSCNNDPGKTENSNLKLSGVSRLGEKPLSRKNFSYNVRLSTMVAGTECHYGSPFKKAHTDKNGQFQFTIALRDFDFPQRSPGCPPMNSQTAIVTG